MIKCNHCGKMTSTGAFCQSCGAPLAVKVDDGFLPRTGAQEQSELPAWLESLRAGERSAPVSNSSSNFSTADFIEEGSLPSWMRAERGDSRDSSISHSPLSPFPAQNAGGNPPPGLDVQSLIDEKSLPSWMRESKSATPSSPGNVSAPNQGQQDNVPDWMKTLQQPQPGSPSTGSSNQAPAPFQPQQQPPTPTGSGFSARDLIDQQSLPSWMQGPEATSAPRGNTGSNFNLAASTPSLPANQQPPVQSGFSARDLIDQQSLPSWMQGSDATSAPHGNSGNMGSNFNAPSPAPTPSSPINQQPPAQSGFSASSLLDVNALPAWLREGEQGRPAVGTGNNVPGNGQPVGQPSSPASPAGGQFGNNLLSASSFIDENSLPSWLRTGSEAGGQPGAAGRARPQGSPIPHRAENMRVPSRPRGEINSSESSELAANVFASMLGVASNSPNFPMDQHPGQPAAAAPKMPQAPESNVQSYQQMQAPDSNYPQGNASPAANPYGQLNSSGQQGQAPAPYSSLANIPNPGAVPQSPMQQGGLYDGSMGMNPGGNNGRMSGIYGGMQGSNVADQNNAAMSGNMPGGYAGMGGAPSMNGFSQYPGNANAMGMPTPQPSAPKASEEQKNTKKRGGIFEAIREWLSR